MTYNNTYSVSGASGTQRLVLHPGGAIDPSGMFLYAAASTNIYGYAINPVTGALTALAGSPFATQPSPTSLAAVSRRCSLDIDGNGILDAPTDGLMLLRAMFGLTGSAVTNGALGGNAPRNTWAHVCSFLNANCGTAFSP
jgi:hypothetical protein